MPIRRAGRAVRSRMMPIQRAGRLRMMPIRLAGQMLYAVQHFAAIMVSNMGVLYSVQHFTAIMVCKIGNVVWRATFLEIRPRYRVEMLYKVQYPAENSQY
ncbi:hypothetical protein [Paenibacillus gansuensis]|uniref:Uncharacterized protein n=1 Tax=Paenibacillus gansuensis TaxID=306542 RepID=A0ABW5PJP0_9BACL